MCIFSGCMQQTLFMRHQMRWPRTSEYRYESGTASSAYVVLDLTVAA